MMVYFQSVVRRVTIFASSDTLLKTKTVSNLYNETGHTVQLKVYALGKQT